MKKKNKVDLVHKYITGYILLILAIALIFEIVNKNWATLFVTVLTIFLCLSPYFFQKKYNIYLPPEIQLGIVLFIYASMFLGEVRNFYIKYWWWDSLLHTFSGFAMALIVFGIMYIFYRTEKINTSPFFIAILIFSITMTIGVLWEIYEFGYDNFFEGNMQRARNLCPEFGECDTRVGIYDTMKDFMLNGIGALFSSILGYIYLKKGEQRLLNGMINRFVENNPRLFYK